MPRAEDVEAIVGRLDALSLAEDEHAPHVVLLIDDDLGPGPAAGPFNGAMPALEAAERLQEVFDTTFDPPIRTRVVRLFTPAQD